MPSNRCSCNNIYVRALDLSSGVRRDVPCGLWSCPVCNPLLVHIQRERIRKNIYKWERIRMATFGLSYFRSVPDEDFKDRDGNLIETDKTLYGEEVEIDSGTGEIINRYDVDPESNKVIWNSGYDKRIYGIIKEYDVDGETGDKIEYHIDSKTGEIVKEVIIERRIKGYKIHPINHAKQFQKIFDRFIREVRRLCKSKKYENDVHFQKLARLMFYRVNELTKKNYMHIHILIDLYLSWNIFHPILERIARGITGEKERALISLNIKEIKDRLKVVNQISEYLVKQMKEKYGEKDYQEKDGAIGHSAKAMVNTHFVFEEDGVDEDGEVVGVKVSRGKRPFHRVRSESRNFATDEFKAEEKKRKEENRKPLYIEFKYGKREPKLNLLALEYLRKKEYEKLTYLSQINGKLPGAWDPDASSVEKSLRALQKLKIWHLHHKKASENMD